MRVGVIGCGSAGPAAALLLARDGHHVELFERAPELLPVGTGFLLQPTGQWVLRQLGVLDAVESHGARVRRLYSHTVEDRVLLDLRYEDLGEGVLGLGMHRASLLKFLVDAAVSEGVELRCGVEIESRERSGGRYHLLGNGERYGPFDLVIVANGARSSAREWVGATKRAKQYPWGAMWTITPDPTRLFASELHQVVNGAHTMLGFLGTGIRADDPQRQPLVSLFWSIRADEVDAARRRGARDLADRIRRLHPEADSVLDPIDSMEHWSFAEYLDVVMSRWHSDGCVVLGDAAHAMSPQLGQGVNLALWDAWTLAQCIREHSDLPKALARYTQRRRAHLRFYQIATRWLTPFFQSSIPMASQLRNLALPLMGSIPPLERQMLRSMAGVKQGLVRRSLTLD